MVTELPNLSSWKKKRKTTFAPLLSSDNVHTGRRPGSRDLCASNRIRIGTVLFCFIKFHVVQLCSLFVVILLFCCAVIMSVYHTLYDTYSVNNFGMFFSVLKIVGLHYEVALALVDYSTTCTRCKYYFLLK